MVEYSSRAGVLAVLLFGALCSGSCRGEKDASSVPDAGVEQREFLSQTDEDYAFLERIQSNAYDIDGSFPPFGSNWQKVAAEETLIRRIADIGKTTEIEKQASREELRTLIRQLPESHLSTRLENPFVYFIATEVDNRRVVGADFHDFYGQCQTHVSCSRMPCGFRDA